MIEITWHLNEGIMEKEQHISWYVHMFINDIHFGYIIIMRVFYPSAGTFLQTQEPRPQYCLKPGLPLQTQEPRLQFYYGWMDRCGSFPLLSAPHSLFSIWTKRSERIPGAPTRRGGEWIWLTAPSGLHRNSPPRLNIRSIRVFDQIRDPEIPINHPSSPKSP